MPASSISLGADIGREISDRTVQLGDGLIHFVWGDARSWRMPAEAAGRVVQFFGLAEFIARCSWVQQLAWTSAGPPSTRRQTFAVYRASLPVTLVDQAWATPTTIYRPADYGFLFPPAGFAAGLQGAQDFAPYEGRILLVEEEVGLTDARGKLVNITNALPALATMGALVAKEEWELESGTTTIQLGSPPRLDFRDLVNRVRSHSSQQIQWF